MVSRISTGLSQSDHRDDARPAGRRAGDRDRDRRQKRRGRRHRLQGRSDLREQIQVLERPPQPTAAGASTMKESPAKLGLIGVGLIAALGGVIWEAFRPIDSPTAMGADGQSDWLAIITQIGGVVAIVMGAFADIKKAIPP